MNRTINVIFKCMCMLSFFSFTSPKYVKYSDRIVSTYYRELKKKHGLYLEGEGGAMMHDIKKVNLFFVSYDNVTIEEARRMYIDIVEGLLERYNENEQIRPFLHDFPFTPNNTEISIRFEDEQKKERSGGEIAAVFRVNDRGIFYETFDHTKKRYEVLHLEPYEEALAIVNQEKNSAQSCYTNNCLKGR